MLSTQNHASSISRKAFVTTAALGASTLLIPKQLLADDTEIGNSANEASTLWDAAVSEARREGFPVYENLPSGTAPTPRYHVTGVTQDRDIWYKGILGVTRGVAAYNAYDNGNIDACYDAYIGVGSGLQVVWCTHSYTHIDSGQTLAVRYSCNLNWPSHVISCTCDFYAEFWANGSGYLTGGPIA